MSLTYVTVVCWMDMNAARISVSSYFSWLRPYAGRHVSGVQQFTAHQGNRISGTPGASQPGPRESRSSRETGGLRGVHGGAPESNVERCGVATEAAGPDRQLQITAERVVVFTDRVDRPANCLRDRNPGTFGLAREHAITTAQAITSLDTPIGDDGAALQDFLEDDSAVGPDELAVEAVGREALEQVLNALPERERQVLVLRFGLDSGTPRTLEEVGAVMGFPRERARQVERDALAALRSPEIRARLEDLVAA
jgi:RNA polymerase sigma factor (sigma-70 family)